MKFISQLLFFFIAALIITLMVLYMLFTRITNHPNTNQVDSFSNLRNDNSSYDKLSKAKFTLYDANLSNHEKVDSLYTPIICRPPEQSGKTYAGQCTNELYPRQTSPYGKGEMTSPCNPEIEAKYYAQRPLIAPKTYHDMLTLLFRQMKDDVPNHIPKNNLRFPQEYCNDKMYSNVMKYIMRKLNKTMANNKVFQDYAKADTWDGESFAYLYQKVLLFTAHDMIDYSDAKQAEIVKRNEPLGAKKLVVSFTLYNTLRNISTDVVATLYFKHGKFYLENIRFATLEPNDEGVRPVNIPGNARKEEINLNNTDLPSNDAGPIWIYGNTIENQYFTPEGYHSPHQQDNLFIVGGVPSQFNRILRKLDQGYLSKPSNGYNRFKGGPLYPSHVTTQTTSKITPNYPQNKSKHLSVYV